MLISERNRELQVSHWLTLILFILLGLFLRWYQLDLRPLHHDESLHGMYSFYFFNNAKTGFYKYDPLLHGPALYHMIPWSYWFFGISKWALRFPAALLGSLFIFIPFFFRHYLTRFQLIFLTGFICLSPSLVYWSRFIRHDMIVIFSSFLILWGILNKVPFFRFVLIGLGVGLSFSAKENSYVHLVLILVYFIYEAILLRISRPFIKSSARKTFSFFLLHKMSFLIGFLLCALVFSYFYSAGFVYPEGILDGLYRKSLSYWFNQHQQERITGPFTYSFLVNSFYEFWWLPFLFIHLLFFYRTAGLVAGMTFLSSFIIALIFHFVIPNALTNQFVFMILKLKLPMDFYLFFPLIFHAIIFTTVSLLDDNRPLAISGYLFFSLLFSYSYLGEKVPWLAIYSLITGIVFFTLYFEKIFNWYWMIPFAPIIIFTGYQSYLLNIKESGSKHHLISQVQTTHAYEDMAKKLSHNISQFSPGRGPLIFAKGDNTWPLTWFLYGRPEYHYLLRGRYLPEFDYVLTNADDYKAEELLRFSHSKTVIPLRWWYLPDFKKLNIKGFVNYWLFKEPWNSPGEMPIWLFERNRVLTNE